ncbi:MAG: hypothetical protein BWK79_18070 [Beggiatoa sp. IS2]|nr:MAG: hypothetical protein BWK79_18070 [Beggiatoa sp. IS2]
MMKELYLTQQELPHHKRWFQDNYFDLFIWQDKQGNIVNFQLCYDRLGKERVIQWDSERGFGHHSVDDGESAPNKNMTPVFIGQEIFFYQEIVPHFKQRSQKLEPVISQFILQKLTEYSKLYAG